MLVELVPILPDGAPCSEAQSQPGFPPGLADAYAELYRARGYHPPWIGYLARCGDEYVGSCGFKGPPTEGRVEIAYFTFPAFEGRGVATAMARALLDLAAGDPGVTVTARTLPAAGASTAILRKLGFTCQGEVEDAEDGVVWEWVLERETRRP